MAAANKRIAVYPGTFDPLTNGHVSLARRAGDIFDRVVVAVAADTHKQTLFSCEERLQIARESFANQGNIEVDSFSGLLVDYVRQKGAKVVVRGLRAVSDFEYEFQLALLNRKMRRDIQTIFLMTDYRWLYISSTIIKTAASLGGDVSGLVPEPALKRLREKFASPGGSDRGA